MPRSKSRNKRYTPKQVKLPSLLNALPVPSDMVRQWNHDLRDRLLRLKLAGFNGYDLALLVFSFGQVWLLAEAMSNCDEIRKSIEEGITQLDQNVLQSPTSIADNVFDELVALSEMSTEVLAASLKIEYIRACDKLKQDGAVKFVDDFLVTLAKANLLEVTKE